jgi:hypothetical protein
LLRRSLPPEQFEQYEKFRADEKPERDAALRAIFAEPTREGIIAFLYRYCSSALRGDAVLAIFAVLPRDDLFWPVVAAAWSGFDNIDHKVFGREFRDRRGAWSPNCMSETDRATYAELPARFTIYRGQDANGPVKNAWTFSRDVAGGFAEGYRVSNRNPIVLTAETTKANVALVQTERSEAEVVVFKRPSRIQAAVWRARP